MPNIDPMILLLVSAIIAAGSALQAAVGFGLGMVAAPVLMLLDPVFVPGPILGSSMLLMILVAYRERKSIDLKGLQYAVIGRAVGTAPATYLIAVASQRFFDLIFGATVVFAVIVSWLGKHFHLTKQRALVAGILSGFMGTTSSIGGPPVALLYQHGEPERVRGTLAGFFIFGTFISILGLALAGRFGIREIKFTLLIAPAVVV